MIRNISGAVNWAGFAVSSCYSNFDSSRLYNEHLRDDSQYEHYADDWDEEGDASGWRCPTWR